MKKTYYIPFAYERYGRMPVDAESKEEAFELAEEKLSSMSVKDMKELTEYLPDSEEIDYDGIVQDENGNIIEDENTW